MLKKKIMKIASLQPKYDYSKPAEARLTMSKNIKLSEQAGFRIREMDDVEWSDDVITAREISIRIYQPKNKVGKHPVVVYLHGGGFVLGDLETEHPRCLEICNRTNSVVISVDYKLAPEYPFPSGFLDVDEVIDWIFSNACKLNINKEKMALIGCSAGGCLAAGVLLMRRDEYKKMPIFQMLIYPVLDDRMQHYSMDTYTDTPVWNSKSNAQVWSQYLVENNEFSLMYASPLRNDNYKGLPDTYIMIADLDPLRDEAMMYGKLLVESGVNTEIHNYPGTFHGFDTLTELSISVRAREEQYAVLNENLYN